MKSPFIIPGLELMVDLDCIQSIGRVTSEGFYEWRKVSLKSKNDVLVEILFISGTFERHILAEENVKTFMSWFENFPKVAKIDEMMK